MRPRQKLNKKKKKKSGAVTFYSNPCWANEMVVRMLLMSTFEDVNIREKLTSRKKKV